MEYPFAPLAGALDVVPALHHFGCRPGDGVSEDVRVAPHQLLDDAAGNAGKVAPALLLGKQRQEKGVVQEIPHLAGDLIAAARLGGVNQLISLFKGVGDDIGNVLLAVPGAILPQAPDHAVQFQEAVGQTPGCGFIFIACH